MAVMPATVAGGLKVFGLGTNLPPASPILKASPIHQSIPGSPNHLHSQTIPGSPGNLHQKTSRAAPTQSPVFGNLLLPPPAASVTSLGSILEENTHLREENSALRRDHSNQQSQIDQLSTEIANLMQEVERLHNLLAFSIH